MFRKLPSLTSCVLLLIASLSMSGCREEDPVAQPTPEQSSDGWTLHKGTVVLYTDSTEWRVYIECVGVLYGSGYAVDSPYHIPNKDEAQVLRHYTLNSNTCRYVTSDGYTFGMPSASVTKAGAKTKYGVLGLWIRNTIVDVPF